MAVVDTNAVESNQRPAWLDALPKFAEAPPPQRSNWLWSGLKTGGNQAIGAIGSAEQAVGTLTGWQGLADYGKSVADNREKLAQESGRPDLEEHPWSLPGMGYQIAKAIPAVGGMIAAGALVPEAAVPGALVRAGTLVPKILGGGNAFAGRVLGAAAAGYPLATGANVEEYKKSHGGELTPGASAESLALGVPEAVVGGLGPASFHGPVAGKLAQRLLTGGAMGAVVQAPQAAVQAALTGVMDPNKTTTERAKDVVNAALGGALVGGAFGGTLRAFQRRSAGDILTDPKALTEASDALLSTQPPDQPAQLPAPSERKMLTYNPKEPAPAAEAPDVISQPGPTENPLGAGRMTGPFALLPEPELRTKAKDLATKERTPDEDMQHALLQEEITKRTPPGGDADQHTLFTPDEMGARVPAAEAFGEQQRAANPSIPEDAPVLRNVTSEPELINAVNKALDAHAEDGVGKPPKYLQELAKKYALDGEPIADKVVAQEGKVNELWEKAKRNPGMAKKAQAAQAELARLRGVQQLHTQADELLKAQEAPPAASETEATPPALGSEGTGPEKNVTLAAEASSPIPPPPDGLTLAVTKHWENMSNLFGLMRDTDPEVAGRALNALDAIKAGNTKRGIQLASRLARENVDVLQEKSAEASPVAEATPPTDNEVDLTAHEDIAPDHPAIKDGSTLDWVHPDATEIPEGIVARAGPDGGRILPDLAPRPAPVVTSPAEHTAAVQQGYRDTATQLMADPNTSDAQKALLQRALTRADAGSHSALIEAMNTVEKAKQARNPDGPFTGAAEKVVGTDSVPAEHVGFVNGLMKALRMGGIRVLIAHPDDVTGAAGDTHGLNGDYRAARLTPGVAASDPDAIAHVRQFGPDGKDFMVYVKPGMSDAETITALGHEVGHIAEKVLFNQAPASTKAAINKSFEQFLKQTQWMKAQDMVRLLRNKTMADAAAAKLDPNLLVSDLPNGDYYRSFSEWFADNTSKWLTSGIDGAKEKPRTAVDRFFAAVAQKWRDVVSSITGDAFAPDATVKKFLNSVVNSKTDRMWAGDADGSVKFAKATAPEGPQDVVGMNDAAKQATKGIDDLWGRLQRAVIDTKTNVMPGVRNSIAGLRWMPGDTMARVAESIGLTAGRSQIDLQKKRGVIEDKMHQTAANALNALTARPVGEQQIMQKLMNLTAYGADGRTPFNKQLDLHDKPNRAALKAMVDDANKDYARLKQMDGGKGAAAFNQAITAHKMWRMADLASAMQELVEKRYHSRGEIIPDFKTDVFDRFQMDPSLHDDVQKAAEFFANELDANRKAVDAYIGHAGNTAAALDGTNPTQADATRATVDDLKYLKKMTDLGVGQLSRPYFHLGRDGDYFVAGDIAKGEDGLVKPEAIQFLQDEMDKQGIKNVALMKDSDTARIMSRVDTPAKMERLAAIFEKAKALGHLDPATDIARGYPDQVNTLLKIAPGHVQRYIEQLKGAPLELPENADALTRKAYEEANEAVLQHAIRGWLDMQRENSLNKANVERTGAHGYDPDMFKNMAMRAAMTARAVASRATSARFAQNAKDIHDQVQRSKVEGSDPIRMQDYANEFLRREAQRSWNIDNHGWDAVQRFQHAVVIGANPAYVLTMMSQVPTLSLPELAKTHGFMQSSLALSKNAAMAFKVMSATLGDNIHFGMSEKVLQDAGIPKKVIDTILTQDNRGNVSTSSYTRQMTKKQLGAEADSARNKLRDWSNVLGYSSEMYPRVLTALAAGDLYDQKPVQGLARDEFIERAVNGSQFEWGPGTSSRAVGKLGVFGPASQLMLAFTMFQSKMIGKYYTEMRALLGKEGPQAAKEAGKFLAGHIAAATVLAGTLGLPGAGWFAGAADKLGSALTGRDDFDVNASYRHWLATTFGPAVAEVLAKGLPRAAGLDLSHLGDQHLLPFTQFMEEKRKFEDAESDWLHNMSGSAIGMAGNMVLGGRDIMNGDYMPGLQKLLPGSFLKGSLQAFRMSEHGYEDRNGIQLPLTPGAHDIMLTALGLKPADKAEYDDENKVRQGVLAQRQYHSQMITKHVELGINHHDPEQLQQGITEARDYTLNNPGMPSPLADVGKNVEKYAKKGAIARGMGLPIGVPPNDIRLRQILGYGNYNK